MNDMKRDAQYYLLVLEGGIHPDCIGPYKTEAERDKDARTLHRDLDRDGEDDAVCWATITRDANGVPVLSAGSYSGAFFQEDALSEEVAAEPSPTGCMFAAD